MRSRRFVSLQQIIDDQNWTNWFLIAMVILLFGILMIDGARVDDNAKAIDQLRKELAGICTLEAPR